MAGPSRGHRFPGVQAARKALLSAAQAGLGPCLSCADCCLMTCRPACSTSPLCCVLAAPLQQPSCRCYIEIVRPLVCLQSMVDLAGLYRVWNPKFNSYSVFGQDHVAKLLLSWNVADGHDAVGDAMKSIALFKLYQRLKPDEKGWTEALVRCLVPSLPESFWPGTPNMSRRHPLSVHAGQALGSHTRAIFCQATPLL